MCTRLCETGGVDYVEVDYMYTHLRTLFEGVPGCSKMPQIHL